MKSYKHLTLEQRYHISALKRSGKSNAMIGLELGVHGTTVSRELRRNGNGGCYYPLLAQESAGLRHVSGAFTRRFPLGVWEVVSELLRRKLSPEQISGRLLREVGFGISHETIYRFVLRDKESGGGLYLNLRCRKERKKRYGVPERRGRMKNLVSIDERPSIVERRSRIGDWEGDTMTGKNHRGRIVTLTERRTRFLLAGSSGTKHAAKVTGKVIELLTPHRKRCKTMTFDRGTEFAGHGTIAGELGTKVYFAHPYSAWERGTNENTNGLLRQYFPKKTDLGKVPEEELQKAVDDLNHRPRKTLGFKTPFEAFYGKNKRYVASTAALALQM